MCPQCANKNAKCMTCHDCNWISPITRLNVRHNKTQLLHHYSLCGPTSSSHVASYVHMIVTSVLYPLPATHRCIATYYALRCLQICNLLYTFLVNAIVGTRKTPPAQVAGDAHYKREVFALIDGRINTTSASSMNLALYGTGTQFDSRVHTNMLCPVGQLIMLQTPTSEGACTMSFALVNV